jgi:hypothetical protein
VKDTDKHEFAHILRKTLGTYHRDLDPEIADVWWQVMQDITIEQFRDACGKHIATSRFAPVPAEIRELSGANISAWPGPEEAWNAMPKTEDESGWMCQEMATAMGAAWDSLERGDYVGARMAFIEVYKREIQGKQGEPKWWISPSSTTTEIQRTQQTIALLSEHPERGSPLMLEQYQDQLLALTTGSVRRLNDMRSMGSVLQSMSTESLPKA